jgi:hypothetical protein
MDPPTALKTRKGALPNLIIIGAQKCATTSLHYYLDLHPQIRMSREKELNFFVRERNWNRGLEWYRSNFRGEAEIRGEASPSYTNYPFFAGVPERMAAVLPEARLIYILRDPLERIISQYIHFHADGLESRPLSEALRDFAGHNRYVLRSRYALQLEQYLAHFSKSQVLITTLEALRGQPHSVMQEIFEFLDVAPGFSSTRFLDVRHASDAKRRKGRIGLLLKRMSETRPARLFPSEVRRKIGEVLYRPFSIRIERPVLEGGLRAELEAYLKEDADRLRALTGLEFEEWCV